MTILSKQLIALFSLALLPFLISSVSNYEDVDALDKEKAYAFFVSPENISFISYSKNWDKDKLKDLHTELLKNTHGQELNELRKVIVNHEPDKKHLGDYSSTKKEINLYNGKERKKIKDVRETLSHEYGHHVQYTYFPTLGYGKDSTWLKLRGLEGSPIFTDDELGSAKYSKHHKWFLCEIFAEDYAALYGTERNEKNIPLSILSLPYFNEEVENQEIPHVATLPKVQAYIAEKTGLPLPKDLTTHKTLPIDIKTISNRSIRYPKLIDHQLYINEKPFSTKQYKHYLRFYKKQTNQTYKNSYEEVSFDFIAKQNKEGYSYFYLEDEALWWYNSLNQNGYHADGLIVVDIISKNEENDRIETYNQLYIRIKGQNSWKLDTRILTEKEKESIIPKLREQ